MGPKLRSSTSRSNLGRAAKATARGGRRASGAVQLRSPAKASRARGRGSRATRVKLAAARPRSRSKAKQHAAGGGSAGASDVQGDEAQMPVDVQDEDAEDAAGDAAGENAASAAGGAADKQAADEDAEDDAEDAEDGAEDAEDDAEDDDAEDEAHDASEADEGGLEKKLYSKITSKQYAQMFDDASLRPEFEGLKVRRQLHACDAVNACFDARCTAAQVVVNPNVGGKFSKGFSATVSGGSARQCRLFNSLVLTVNFDDATPMFIPDADVRRMERVITLGGLGAPSLKERREGNDISQSMVWVHKQDFASRQKRR